MLKQSYERDLRGIEDDLATIERLNLPVPHETDTGLLQWQYNRLQDGVLAENGGVNQQPAHYVADMRFMDRLDYYHDLPTLIQDCEGEMTRILKDNQTGGLT